MRKLSIILSTVVAVVLVAVLAVPFGMGLWVQKRYPQVIAQFDTPHVSFVLLDFKRGWFHSRAHLQVTFHSAETTLSGDAIPLAQVVIAQEIQHGPWVREKTLDGKRHWLLARAAVYNESQADNLNFKANMLWTMANRINADLNIQHLLLGNDRQRIEINQLLGRIVFTPSDTHFQSQLTLGSGALYANNPDKVGNNIIDLVKVMELDHFATNLDIRKIKTLWYGARHFSAEKIQIFPYGGETIIIDNLAADLNQNQHNELTDFNVANQVGAIRSGQFKIGQLQMALTLKDMDTNLLENFARVFMYGADFQRLKLYSLLVDLLTKGMTVDLSQFHFTTANGPVSLQAQITSTPAESAEAGVLHWLENLNIQASADVPKAWLQDNLAAYYQIKKSENPRLQIHPQTLAAQYIAYWQAHHLLMPEGEQVTMALVYKEGRLLINGEKPALTNGIR